MSGKVNLSQNKKVQELLEAAEKRAQETIENAKARAKAKINNACVEAKIEIEVYTKEMEAEYKKLLEKIQSEIAEDQKLIDKDAESVMKTEKQHVKDHKQKVVDLLMEAVLDIKPRIHRNYRLRRHLDKTFGPDSWSHSPISEKPHDASTNSSTHQHSPRVTHRQGLPSGSHSPRPQLNGLQNNRIQSTRSPAKKGPPSGGINTATHK